MAVILEVCDASFAYANGHHVFGEISFSLEEGGVLSILGPNGTGKSTLIKCLTGILRLDRGSVSLYGDEITAMKRADVASAIGYVPQAHQIVFPFSVREFVLMGRAPHLGPFAVPGRRDREIAQQAMETVGVSHLADRAVSEISGGEHQLVMVARALAQEPAILLLDEPTSHLDFGNQIRILTLIEKLARRGIAVIQSTHFPDHGFLLSGSAAIMEGGAFIARGQTEEVITAENLKRAYGVDVSVQFFEQARRKICIPLVDCDEGVS